MKVRLLVAVAGAALVAFAGTGEAGMDEARKWVESEFQPSTLSKEEQLDTPINLANLMVL